MEHVHTFDLAGVCTGDGPCDITSRDRSPKQNWVDKAGGMPPYIKAIRNALLRKGHSMGKASALAVGTAKNWAAGKGDVSAETRARAAAAVAQWEAMKAKAASMSADDTTTVDLARRGPLSAAHRAAISRALARRGRTSGPDPYIRHPRIRRLVEQNTGSFGRQLARARGGSNQRQLDAIRQQARARRQAPGVRQTPQQLTQRINNMPTAQRQAIRQRASAPEGFRWNSRHMLEPAPRAQAPRAEPADHAEQRAAIEAVRRRAGVPTGRPTPTPSSRPTPRTPGARVMQGNETISLRDHVNQPQQRTPENRPSRPAPSRADRTTLESRRQARQVITQAAALNDVQREAFARSHPAPQGYTWRRVAGVPTLMPNSSRGAGSRTNLAAEGTSVDLSALARFADLTPAQQRQVIDFASGQETQKQKDKRISKAGGYDSNQGLKAQGAAGQQADGDFNSKHPRASAGNPNGGQFIAAGSGGAGASQSEQEQVKAVQAEIGVAQTGSFSQADAEALKGWQAKQGLQVDGKAGAQTVSRMSDGPDKGPGSLGIADRAWLQKRGSQNRSAARDGAMPALGAPPNQRGTASRRRRRAEDGSTVSYSAVDLAAAPPQMMRAVMALRRTKNPAQRKRLATAIRKSAMNTKGMR